MVTCLLGYALVKFRARPSDTTEPPQVFDSLQIELAWTIIPILIIVVLFLGNSAGSVLSTGRAKAGFGARCDRGRPPVLVGVSIPAVQRCHRERTTRSA